MGIAERDGGAELERAVSAAVWGTHGKGLPDKAAAIANELSAFTTGDKEMVAKIAKDAMNAPEIFDSLNPEADDAIAQVLVLGVPVHLWTIGRLEVQVKKAAVVTRRVREKLITMYNSVDAATLLIGKNLRYSISENDKMDTFERILAQARKDEKTRVFVAEDNEKNLVSVTQMTEGIGMRAQSFLIKKNDPLADFPACKIFLAGWLGNNPHDAVVVLDIDDTVFNETGPDGRISKIAKVLARNLAAR